MRTDPRTPRRSSALRASILTASILALCSCATGEASQAMDDERAAPQSGAADKLREPLGEDVPAADQQPARALSSAFRAAADRALPAVVFISAEREAPANAEDVPDIFRFFFDSPPGQQPQPRPSSGSGFIFKQDGHIITNAHVVEGASNLTVRLLDGREFDGRVVATDTDTDVAVIKIEPGDLRLPTATLGSSDEVRVGDWVLALGSPLGLDFTVTAGIVSAKGRAMTGRSQTALESFIQTDAAVNPGNSGGPLVDLDGRVIGINTLIFGGPTFVGYSFAIPIDLAQRVVRDLLEYGHVRRPRLGVRISPVDAVDAEAYGLDAVSGAEINTVEPDSPAEEAGLRPGDVVVALNGKEIGDATALTTGLAQLKPGDEAELTIIRNGDRKKVTVELGEFERETASNERGRTPESPHQTLGFSVADLDRDLAQQLGIDRTEGVVITRVRPGSSAQNAGIQEGQVVLTINGKPVRSKGDIEELAEGIARGSVVSVRVQPPEGGETIINYRAR
jgi:serine protease Do